MIKKIIKISEVQGLLNEGKKVRVKTINDEFTNITNYIEKGLLDTFNVILEDNFSIKTSKEHKFFSDQGWIETQNLQPNETKLLCQDKKFRLVKSVCFIGQEKIVDISVEHPEHCYFGNNILNHNTGKSYMAAQIAANAQKKGITVIYFDSESALDPDFLKNAGCDLNKLVYIQATTVEFVFSTVEDLLANNEERMLFIWDSFSNTACKADLENTLDVGGPPKAPHIATMALKKLTLPIANMQATFLVLNQLKTNINISNPNDMLVNPYFAPGGKALPYAYSLRIWLTGRKAKDSFVVDENGFRIGSEVKAKLKKCRFGCEGRECTFKIVWGGENISIKDEESWLDAIKSSERYKGGAWKEIELNDGEVIKFQEANWLEKLKEPKFRESVLSIMDEYLIEKFANKTGKAKDYYSVDGESIKNLEEIETELNV